MSTPDVRLIEIANRGHGVVSRDELIAAGFTPKMIRTRRESGLLVPVDGGIYGLGCVPESREGRVRAAQLVLPGSAAYRETAAALHAFPGRWHGTEIVTRRGGRNRVALATVHETSHLPAADIVTVDGLVLTTPERTLCDLATCLLPARLSWLMQRLIIAGGVDVEVLVATFRAFARRGRGGTQRMRAVLDRLLDGPGFGESELEQLFIEIQIAHHLPHFERQVKPPWYDGIRGIVDFHRPIERAIVETDGRAWHTIQQAIDDDRRRDRRARRHGYDVLRLGWSECKHRPDEVAEEVRAFLAACRRRAA